ncbi:MAG TPA: hypothetical protein VJR89_36000 [Polyangiales bacterium]|nr:hypothetical protein [Polyangiales bacterium]
MLPRRLLFFIDRIEGASDPATDDGYALLYRAFVRARRCGDEIYVAYPETPWTRGPDGHVYAFAHRVLSFRASPYAWFTDEQPACHAVSDELTLELDTLDAVIWQLSSGNAERNRQLLRALARVEQHTLVYPSPRFALDPRLGAKVLPGLADPHFTPKTHHTAGYAADGCRIGARDKARRAVTFLREALGSAGTAIVKPLHGAHGVGVHVLGVDPRTGRIGTALDDVAALCELLERYGDLVVQEYIASLRDEQFGEVRFSLIDGEIPRTATGKPCRVPRRVPTPDSLLADSGVPSGSELTQPELEFVTRLGALYRQWGIHCGGGDLIRTPEPERPFVFIDAAQWVSGDAVVTGVLNGEPYGVVDAVLDSIDRQIQRRGDEVRTLAQLSTV